MPAPLNGRTCTPVILSGATQSEEVDLGFSGGAVKHMMIFTPSAVVEVIQVYVAPKVGGTYLPLDDSYGNIYTLQNGHAQAITPFLAGAMKLVATGAVAADRTFTLMGERLQK